MDKNYGDRKSSKDQVVLLLNGLFMAYKPLTQWGDPPSSAGYHQTRSISSKMSVGLVHSRCVAGRPALQKDKHRVIQSDLSYPLVGGHLTFERVT